MFYNNYKDEELYIDLIDNYKFKYSKLFNLSNIQNSKPNQFLYYAN